MRDDCTRTDCVIKFLRRLEDTFHKLCRMGMSSYDGHDANSSFWLVQTTFFLTKTYSRPYGYNNSTESIQQWQENVQILSRWILSELTNLLLVFYEEHLTPLKTFSATKRSGGLRHQSGNWWLWSHHNHKFDHLKTQGHKGDHQIFAPHPSSHLCLRLLRCISCCTVVGVRFWPRRRKHVKEGIILLVLLPTGSQREMLCWWRTWSASPSLSLAGLSGCI